jgi:hypothetical protein
LRARRIPTAISRQQRWRANCIVICVTSASYAPSWSPDLAGVLAPVDSVDVALELPEEVLAALAAKKPSDLPPLDANARWALVRRMVTDDGRPVEGIGVPVRDSDQTRWLSGDEVYQLIREGQRANSSPAPRTHPQVTIATFSAGEALDRLIVHKDWDSPILAWQSIPEGTVDLLARLWGKEGISQSLRNPPSLRSAGFNWYFMTEITQFENGLLASDGRHAIWVRENGLVTAAATVTEDMLSWAMHNEPGRPYHLNLIALIEMTLEYYRLVDRAILPGTYTNYRHAVTTRRFAGDPPVALSPTLPPAISFEEHRATQDERREFRASAQEEHDAYEALWRLFAAFQFGPERVPLTMEDRIDTDKLIDYLKNHR